MAGRGWRAWRVGVPVVAALAVMGPMAGVSRAAQPLGALTQLSGTAGCFTFNGASEDGAGTCEPARGLAEGESATVSPDGANVYVGSYSDASGSGFAVFSRNPATGALTQLTGTAGCLTVDGSSSAGAGTCTKVRGLITNAGDGHDLAFTSDGRWAYIVAQNGSSPGAVLIFQRDPSTGALTQLPGSDGCITPNGSSQDGAATCRTDSTLHYPNGIAISSDDRFIYVTDYGAPNRVHVFWRNTATGALAEIQCISEAPAPAGCDTGRVVGNSESLALSPDGTHAYSGDYFHGVSIFDRDRSTGLLTQKPGTAGCITDTGKDETGSSTCGVGRVLFGSRSMAIAPDGMTLYDPAGKDHGFSVFHVNADGTLTQLSGTHGCVTTDGKDNTGASTCAVGRGDFPYSAAISPDGSTLYLSQGTFGPGGLAIFSLDPKTGIATQLPGLDGCITADGTSNRTAGQCTNGTALSFGYGLSVSPDGRSVYQATDDTTNAGLAVYARETAPVCQSTSAATAFSAPVTVPLRCADADGDTITRQVVTPPAHGTLNAPDDATGTVTYTPKPGFSGTDGITFAASDGVNTGAPATATITVGPQATPSKPPKRTPALSRLHVAPSTFSLAGRTIHGRCVSQTRNSPNKHRCRRPIRLRISFTLNVPDAVVLTLRRQATGRRLIGVRGAITLRGRGGADQFTFQGRIGGHALGAGTYRLTATPTGGTPKTVSFRILGVR